MAATASAPLSQKSKQEAAFDTPVPREAPVESFPKFSERDYRVSASDADNKSLRVWVRIPPYMVRAGQTILAKGGFPFVSLSDLWRFTMFWGMRSLRDNPAPVATVFAQIQAMNDILTAELDNIAFRSTFDRAGAVLMEYQREGTPTAMDEARRVLAELDARISQMPAGYWQTKYAATLRQRFGPLMEGRGMTLVSPETKLALVSGRATREEGLDWSQVGDTDSPVHDGEDD